MFAGHMSNNLLPSLATIILLQTVRHYRAKGALHWRYVALVVVLWRPAVSASASSSSSASVAALR